MDLAQVHIPRNIKMNESNSPQDPMARAEQVELLGLELRELWPDPLFKYVSRRGGIQCLKNLCGEHDRNELFDRLDDLADELRPFEFGRYSELGFLPRAHSPIIPKLSVHIGSNLINIEYIASGHFASVYRISSGPHSYALKVFYRRNAECFTSGPWNETALGIYVTNQGVRNLPHLMVANPKKEWILCSYVGPNYEPPELFGPTYGDLGIRAYDIPKQCEDKNSKKMADGSEYRVDYGHLASIDRLMRARPPSLDGILHRSHPRGDIDTKAILNAFEKHPELRHTLLGLVGYTPEKERFDVLSRMFQYPEGKFYPFQGYLTAKLLPVSDTIRLFRLIVSDPDPSVRANAIFDVSEMADSERIEMEQEWNTRAEFIPFSVYRGLREFPPIKSYIERIY